MEDQMIVKEMAPLRCTFTATDGRRCVLNQWHKSPRKRRGYYVTYGDISDGHLVEGEQSCQWGDGPVYRRQGMKRTEFADHLRSGALATDLVQEITGVKPTIVTIAEMKDDTYTRHGIMMAGNKMCALVILSIRSYRVGMSNMERIRTGEPAGAVLEGMRRLQGKVTVYPKAIKSYADLEFDGQVIGSAQEIFTESLFDE
jgi:hypothetical protein